MTDEIDALLTKYCDLLDAADWDGVGKLFGNGALIGQDGAEIARGATAIADFYRRSIILYDGSPRTKHAVHNTLITDSAATSDFVVTQEEQTIIMGRYEDRFERDDAGSLKFAERRFFVDQVGDLSKHLRFEVS